jgi:putative DNA primase/helicase
MKRRFVGIDIDTKHGDGFAELTVLESEYGALPITYTQQTPSGGEHRVFSVSTPLGNSAGKIAEHIDIRGDGGYLVATGSTIIEDEDGNPLPANQCGTYTDNNLPIVQLPDKWLAMLLSKQGAPRDRNTAPTMIFDNEPTRRQVREFLQSAVPAIQGQKGDNHTIVIINRVLDEGLPIDVALDLLLAHWNGRCQPPWDPKDLRKKIENAWNSRQTPVGSGNVLAQFAEAESDDSAPSPYSDPDVRAEVLYNRHVDMTDTGNANLLLQIADGSLRYVVERRGWLHWSKKTEQWHMDESGEILARHAHLVAQHYSKQSKQFEADAENATKPDDKKRLTKTAESYRRWEIACRSSRRINDMIREAARAEGIPLSEKELDTNPWLLGCANGVIDLQKGTLHPACREEFVTMHCPARFDATAPAPYWEAFIAEATALPGDTPTDYVARPHLADWLQRALGYSITGLTTLQLMFIANGEGCGGKSLLLDTIRRILGPYATTIPSAMMLQSRFTRDPESPTAVAASLFRVRLAIASESREGKQLDVDFVKSHTGDGSQKSRRNREDPFEFERSHKIWLLTNQAPGIDQVDDALLGRLNLIPFDRTRNRVGHPNPDPKKPMADPDLPIKLQAESEGILAWLVRGAVRYAQEGLKPCPEVIVKTRRYFQAQDAVSEWIDECCVCCSVDEGDLAKDLLESYNRYAAENDHRELDGRGFADRLVMRHVEGKKTKLGKRYGLKASSKAVSTTVHDPFN